MKERIRDALSELDLRRLADGPRPQAAVLMPLFQGCDGGGGGWRLLLTKRTEEVETHKGQISFPGGMREGGEALEETALRETFEEVGIPPERVELLGRFHDYLAVTGVRVTPFAALLRTPFPVTPQVHEVAEVLRVPIETFSDPASLRVEKGSFQGEAVNDYYYAYGAHTIWGLTARIIHDFLEALALGGGGR
ncbi:MAG: CoA pyrophosphatase [Acidobacteriota bacterium]|jgi:8-oxo-dGTP pyrophosphatase MutT (NUDIX family)|nr:CoA pyrophosphatase [Acidobacteriota bacterium]